MAGGTNKLSDTSLRKMVGRESPSDSFYADGDGLSIKVSKIGVLTWYFTFRIGGRESNSQRIKLGNYPDLSLKAAREKREQCRSWLAEGKNPKHQLSITTQETLKPVTVKEALDYWIREYATHKRSNVTGSPELRMGWLTGLTHPVTITARCPIWLATPLMVWLIIWPPR